MAHPRPDTVAIVSAYRESERLPATLRGVREAFPGARILVADDGSRDATGHVALQEGAELVRAPLTVGKGGAMTLAAERVLALALEPAMNVAAVRAGFRVGEIELDLSHRATGRTPRGFVHRARQLRDFAAVYLSRR